MGASGTPLDLSWHLTVAAAPMDLSCGHKLQKRQRTLHRVMFGIVGHVGIIGIILGVIIIMFRVIVGVIRIIFGAH